MTVVLDLPDIKIGSDYAVELDFVQADGVTPYSLVGRDYVMTASLTVGGAAVITFVVDASAAVEGVLVATLDHTVTAVLTPDTFFWEIVETITATGWTETLFEGQVQAVL